MQFSELQVVWRFSELAVADLIFQFPEKEVTGLTVSFAFAVCTFSVCCISVFEHRSDCRFG
jgi:hypothetical protein